MKLHLITVIGLLYDLDYLKHHIDFYQNQIDTAHYILNIPIKRTDLVEEANLLLADASCPVKTSIWEGIFDSHTKVRKINAAIKAYLSPDDWIVSPDADEFHVFDDLSLKEAIGKYGKVRKTLFGKFVDRVALDGKPKPLKSDINIWEQFPIDENRTDKIGATNLRPSLFSAEQRLKNCHATFEATYKNYNGPLGKIYHFKWTENTKEKLEQRVVDFKRFQFPWWVESQKALKHYF